MNAARRKAVTAAHDLVQRAFDILETARSAVGDILEEEREAFDNLPESLQASERGQTAEAAIEALESAADLIDGFEFDGVFSNLDAAGE